MKAEDQIKAHLEEAQKIIESALNYMKEDEIEIAAHVIDIATDKMMQAYALAREYSDL